MTLEEFKEYYEINGRLPNGQKEIKQGWNYQYKKYLKKQKKKDDWVEAREKAYRRNPNGEQFFNALTDQEYNFYSNLYGIFATLDPCHIIGKGECPKKELMNNPDNILVAPRYFHSYIDTFKNPFTQEHELITKEQREQIWIRFIGQEMWDELQELKRS